MEKENKITFTFRMPEELYVWSKKEAERIGIPQNALLLMLIDDGRRIKEAKMSINLSTE